ncbi:hypothetical protein [Halorientalis salina]|uniref:hypothetical protein n=1 Tax=Halorientalis salina TaxID=2932266 RepID=UPI00145C4385|nr:hypothetical protein [Halorientalis salina]
MFGGFLTAGCTGQTNDGSTLTTKGEKKNKCQTERRDPTELALLEYRRSWREIHNIQLQIGQINYYEDGTASYEGDGDLDKLRCLSDCEESFLRAVEEFRELQKRAQKLKEDLTSIQDRLDQCDIKKPTLFETEIQTGKQAATVYKQATGKFTDSARRHAQNDNLTSFSAGESYEKGIKLLRQFHTVVPRNEDSVFSGAESEFENPMEDPSTISTKIRVDLTTEE